MSAICAIVHRDGRHADARALAPMFDAAPHRGRDDVSVHADGPAALGCQRAAAGVRATRPRACVERLDPFSIAFHGRIDNRENLLDALADRWPEARADTDARLVLRAFIHWQDGCAARLLGDFAFVVWDAAARRAYCARDAIGVKPLYYYRDGSRFVAATELPQVIASGVPLEPCEPMVAEYLAFDVRSRCDTLYRDICRLPPGHWMTISDRDVRIEQYWRPDCTRELHYADDDQYAGRFSELLARAVGDRAPAGERIGAYLSGGLDSSSVVCMAHALGRQVETFSLLFPGIPEADEREYIDAVTDRIGAPAHRLTVSPLDGEAYRQQPAARADLPDLPGDAVGAPLLSAMRARGVHTILTGVGGDHGFAGSLLHYADLLHEGDLMGLLRQWRADRGTADVGWSPGQLFTSGLRLLIPGPLRRAVRPMARRVGWGSAAPAWLDSDFVRRTCLVERLEAPRGGEGASLPTRRYVCELFESGWTARLLEATDRGAAEHGLELRHPVFDLALVEFAVAIPEAQRWRHRTTKFVMRQALRQLLPESVYARTGKADASRFIAHAVDALGGEDALRRLRIASLGWVRPDAIVDVYRRAQRQYDRGDEAFCDGMFSAWMTLAVDAWYRSVFVEGNVT